MSLAESNVLETSPNVNLTEEESKRFWSKVEKTDSCWLWKASGRRYGSFKFRGKIEKSHRVSFLIHGGKLTKEKPFVLHNCPNGDNGLCVNPDHLWAGNQTDNMRDMEAKGRADHPTGNRCGMRTCPESVMRGSENGCAKLNEETARMVYDLCKNGRLGIKTEIAKKLNVSRGLIGHIVNGRAWNHVTGLPKRK